MLKDELKLSGALFAAFLRDAVNVEISRPWPKTRPDWRVMCFTKAGENFLAAYDMAHHTATVFLRTDDEDETVAMEAVA